MENRCTKLIDVLNRFNEAIQELTEAIQLVKEHDKKYKYLYANENHRIDRKS